MMPLAPLRAAACLLLSAVLWPRAASGAYDYNFFDAGGDAPWTGWMYTKVFKDQNPRLNDRKNKVVMDLAAKFRKQIPESQLEADHAAAKKGVKDFADMLVFYIQVSKFHYEFNAIGLETWRAFNKLAEDPYKNAAAAVT